MRGFSANTSGCSCTIPSLLHSIVFKFSSQACRGLMYFDGNFESNDLISHGDDWTILVLVEKCFGVEFEAARRDLRMFIIVSLLLEEKNSKENYNLQFINFMGDKDALCNKAS